MDISILAVKYLGAISIILAMGFVLFVLTQFGVSTYLKYQDRQKKIEVRTKNPNHKEN